MILSKDPSDFRFWHKADIRRLSSNVRFWGDLVFCWGRTPIASTHVCFRGKADIHYIHLTPSV